MVLIKKIISILMLSSIRVYQYSLSPILGPCCRFYPTCSNYAHQAIRQHGPFKGLFLASKRVLRCHPFHPGGIDPVPQSEHNRTTRTPFAGYRVKG